MRPVIHEKVAELAAVIEKIEVEFFDFLGNLPELRSSKIFETGP